MSFGIKVEGGTGAGCRRAPKPAYSDHWHCTNCGGTNKGNWTRCLTKGCNAFRDREPN